MLTDKAKGYAYYLKQCEELKIPFDLWDYEANIGEDLTYQEILTQLEEKIFKTYENIQNTKQKVLLEQITKIKDSRFKQDYENLHKKKVILVFGETRSGKTALCFSLLDEIKKKKKVYVYKHPLPRVISLLGFENMSNISDLSRIKDCAVFVDEVQLTFPREDKRNNDFLMQLYTLCGQRGITLILSTSDSRWVNKGTESFITTWFVKDCEAELLKNGSKMKTIVKNFSTFGLIDFKLKIDEYLYYDRNETENSGKYIFEVSEYWNDILSTPFR